MTAYLVTGGAGFIGSHIVEELVRRGERVRVLDNFQTGKRENLAPFLKSIELAEADIRDRDACRDAVRGMDVVLHQAALASVPRSVKDPLQSHEVNVTGTLNLLDAARQEGVRRFVFASSSSVYGDDPGLPKVEGREGRTLSPYAVNKAACERYCQVFHLVYGLETVCLRYFNIFGPRQDPFSQYAAVVPLFIRSYLEGRAPVIFGDGEQSRDFTYVTNVVQANLLAAEAPAAPGQVYNIGCGERTTVGLLAGLIGDILGSSLRPAHEPVRAGDVRHSLADISKARKELDYTPRIGFREGLERTVRWHQDKERSA
ncbi:MAG: Vi polysaccharide biosynthesis protein VipB/TviC [Candidatus Aminicenantes bacterium RBG_13_63_10]|nr:MAG: Vi polysaccharide biosynthesis protein VipB/TviC [Candidatus Aminicenantes bacterium RBG_13_63_10]